MTDDERAAIVRLDEQEAAQDAENKAQARIDAARKRAAEVAWEYGEPR